MRIPDPTDPTGQRFVEIKPEDVEVVAEVPDVTKPQGSLAKPSFGVDMDVPTDENTATMTGVEAASAHTIIAKKKKKKKKKAKKTNNIDSAV